MSSTSNNDVKLSPETLDKLQKWAKLPMTSHDAFERAFNRLHNNTLSTPVIKEKCAVPHTPFPQSFRASADSLPSTIAKTKELEREEQIRRVLEMQKSVSEQSVNHHVIYHGVHPIGVVHHGGLPLGVVHHGVHPIGAVYHGGLSLGVVHHGVLPIGGYPVDVRRERLVQERSHSFTPTDSSIGLSRIAPHLVRF